MNWLAALSFKIDRFAHGREHVLSTPLAGALLASVLAIPHLALAAACCGGSFSTPALITGDDLGQSSTSLSYSSLRQYADTSGRRSFQDPEITKTLRLDGAIVFNDLWQAGISTQIGERTQSLSGQDSTAQGIGDTLFNLGYEILPEYTYNEWRPRGFSFLQLRAPTGRSAYESENPLLIDAFGKGFWAIGAGAIFLKTWLPWDMQLAGEIHQSFARNFHDHSLDADITARPGWGESLTFSGGWSHADLRLGGSLAWNYEDPVSLSGAVRTTGALQRFVAASITLNYMLDAEWAAGLTLTDQTLLGRPLNSGLAQTASLVLQRRWAR